MNINNNVIVAIIAKCSFRANYRAMLILEQMKIIITYVEFKLKQNLISETLFLLPEIWIHIPNKKDKINLFPFGPCFKNFYPEYLTSTDRTYLAVEEKPTE